MIMTKLAGFTTIVSALATLAAVAESQLVAAIVFLFGTIIGGVTWYALKEVPAQNARFQAMEDRHRAEMEKRDERAIEATSKLVQELKEGRMQTAQQVTEHMAFLRGLANGKDTKTSTENSV